MTSQNLIPNPSFEIQSLCPYAEGQIIFAVGWNVFGGGTPNYFSTCAQQCSFGCIGVPLNTFGFQSAFQGNSYVGITTYEYSVPTRRDFIYTQLISPFVPGEKYDVSMYVCRGNGPRSFGATNNLCFRFYTQGLHVPPYTNFAHIIDTTIITDSVNWTRISGSFIADSAYNFLVIGNFFENQYTDTIDFGVDSISPVIAYYFIDSVSVIRDPTWVGIKDFNLKNTSLTFYPNPASNKIKFKNYQTNEKIILLNTIGQSIKEVILKEDFDELDISDLQSGIYFVKARNNCKSLVIN